MYVNRNRKSNNFNKNNTRYEQILHLKNSN